MITPLKGLFNIIYIIYHIFQYEANQLAIYKAW